MSRHRALLLAVGSLKGMPASLRKCARSGRSRPILAMRSLNTGLKMASKDMKIRTFWCFSGRRFMAQGGLRHGKT